MLYATPEFVSAVIALPLHRMKSSAFHRQLTERLLPEWTGVDYVDGAGVADHTPHIWQGDGLQVLTELSDGSTAELTWMLDRKKVKTTVDRLHRGQLDCEGYRARTGCSRHSRYLPRLSVTSAGSTPDPPHWPGVEDHPGLWLAKRRVRLQCLQETCA